MNQKTKLARRASACLRHKPMIPTAQLVAEVYESASRDVKDRMLTQLVGQAFEDAPPPEKLLLLEHLLRPLPALSIIALANGLFTKMRLRSDWQEFQIRLENAKYLRASDVMALVDYVQKVSANAIDSLALVLANTPAMAGSVAAALLVALLVRRQVATPKNREPAGK